MKHIAELAVGGFITDNYHHEWIEEMVKQRDASIVSFAGNKKIISGVVVSGDPEVATDGIVVYNGKVYSFVGGAVQTTVTIKRIATDRPNADGIPAAAYYEDIIEFGDDGLETFDFDELKRYYRNQPILKEIKEVAGNITNTDLAGTGWFVADGTNGTDDLRSLFIVGYNSADVDYDAIGKTGGEKKHTLTKTELPNVTIDLDLPAASHTGDETDGNGGDGSAKSVTKTKPLGDSTPHENRPPYFVAIRIQFIGI